MKNKRSTDKKLKLVQQTVRALATPELERVIGGAQAHACVCLSCTHTGKVL
jgi:hypothetical protein